MLKPSLHSCKLSFPHPNLFSIAIQGARDLDSAARQVITSILLIKSTLNTQFLDPQATIISLERLDPTLKNWIIKWIIKY